MEQQLAAIEQRINQDEAALVQVCMPPMHLFGTYLPRWRQWPLLQPSKLPTWNTSSSTFRTTYQHWVRHS